MSFEKVQKLFALEEVLVVVYEMSGRCCKGGRTSGKVSFHVHFPDVVVESTGAQNSTRFCHVRAYVWKHLTDVRIQ